jgi:hypothetical protein
MEPLIRVWFRGVLLCLLSCGIAFAQVGTGQISGRVSDSTGAVLPGAEVTVTQTSTGLTRTAVSNENGFFTFPNLPVGPYRLEAALPQFRTFVQASITLQVNANLVIDPVLEVGQVTQTVEVQANSEVQVETRTLGIGTVIENQRILELPLNGRQVTDLITLSGAAIQTNQSPSYGMATGVNIAVAGANTGIAYTLDGATHSNPYDLTSMPMPFPDALQEFRVSGSSQGAETGRASGGSVAAVTKTGTNAYHGDAFWFVRNAVFNAKDADAPVKDQLKRNQFGVTLGGPIKKNKIFFFGGFQGTALRTAPQSTLSIVPTQAILNGDWRGWNQCYRTNWRDPDFTRGFVDPSRYSSAAKLFAGRLPKAQDDCGRIRWATRTVEDDKQIIGRADYQQSAKNTIFGRYLATWQYAPAQFDPNNLLTSTVRGADDLGQDLTVGDTYIIRPNMINAFRVAYNRISLFHKGGFFFDARDVGIDMWNAPAKHFNIGVGTYFTIGSGTNSLEEQFTKQFQTGDDVSLTKGTHQIAFGGNWWRAEVDEVAFARSVGNLTVNGQITGDPMGDLMLGKLAQIRQSMPNPLRNYQHYIGMYAVDTWRITPKFTLNYGLRWEPFLPMVGLPTRTDILANKPPYNAGIRMYTFDIERFKAGARSIVFSNAPAGFTYPAQVSGGPADPSFIGKTGQKIQWGILAPRIGLAWDPTGQGRTSIRAGYGIAYDVIVMNLLHNQANVAPWSGDTIYTNGSLDKPWDGAPGGNPFPFDFTKTPTYPANSAYVPLYPNNHMTYVNSWNLNVQQRLSGNLLLSVGYLGSSTIHLWDKQAANPSLLLTPGAYPNLFTGPDTCVLEGRSYNPCNQLGNINQRRELRLWAAQSRPALLPDAQTFSYVDWLVSNGTASYHGLLTSLRGQIGKINLNGNYTWSHCIGDKTGGGNPSDTPLVGRDRGDCGTDVRSASYDRHHMVNLSVVAATPQFSNHAVRAIGSGWEVSGIYRVSSAGKVSILSGQDRALNGVTYQNAQRAQEVLGNVHQDQSGKLGSQLLNRAAFAQPALGTIGNMARFSIPGFGTWNIDMALARKFTLREDQRFEIRAEAFNLTNSVRPVNIADNTIGTAQNNLSGGDFGRVTRVYPARVMQFALKYVF